MANAQWPAGVNAQKLLGLVGGPRDNVVRSTVDAGLVKSRRRFTVALEELTFDQHMTKAEFAIFAQWFRDTLQDGALAFDLRNPDDQALTKMKFLAPPRKTLISDNAYRVTLNLLITP